MNKIFFTSCADSDNKLPDVSDPLTFTGDGYVSFRSPVEIKVDIWYKIGDGDWMPYEDDLEVSTKESVSFRNLREGLCADLSDHAQFFVYGGDVYASGDVTSMINYDELHSNCFSRLFGDYQCRSLRTPPNLPSTVLAEQCYAYMFEGSGLWVLPELPATELDLGCYLGMFVDCDELTPIADWCDGSYTLPAYYVPDNAYDSMFRGVYSANAIDGMIDIHGCCFGYAACAYMFSKSTLYSVCSFPFITSDEGAYISDYCFSNMFEHCPNLISADYFEPLQLLQAPPYAFYELFCDSQSLYYGPTSINAEYLGEYCYSGMFHSCFSLSEVAAGLPDAVLSEGCYSSMFRGCESLQRAPVICSEYFEDSPYACESMFMDCLSLESITVYFVEWPSNGATDNWVVGVPPGGVFTHRAGLEIIYSESAIPEGWETAEVDW